MIEFWNRAVILEKNFTMKTGLIGAMREEVLLLRDEFQDLRTEKIGPREFYSGTVGGQQVVMCLSGWGKVAAASTATSLINLYEVDHLLFIGLAGSLQPHLEIGDLVVADKLIQHDVKLSKLVEFPVESPSRRSFEFEIDPAVWQRAFSVSGQFIRNLKERKYPSISGIYHPRVFVGPVATGDQFIASAEGKSRISERFPDALCAEMEGGAVAQVAADYGIPCTVIRIISDQADENAHQAFADFLFRNIGLISVELARLMFTPVSEASFSE